MTGSKEAPPTLALNAVSLGEWTLNPAVQEMDVAFVPAQSSNNLWTVLSGIVFCHSFMRTPLGAPQSLCLGDSRRTAHFEGAEAPRPIPMPHLAVLEFRPFIINRGAHKYTISLSSGR